MVRQERRKKEKRKERNVEKEGSPKASRRVSPNRGRVLPSRDAARNHAACSKLRAAFCTFPFSFFTRRSAPRKRNVSLLLVDVLSRAEFNSYFNRAIDAINFPFLSASEASNVASRVDVSFPPGSYLLGKMKKIARRRCEKLSKRRKWRRSGCPRPLIQGLRARSPPSG